MALTEQFISGGDKAIYADVGHFAISLDPPEKEIPSVGNVLVSVHKLHPAVNRGGAYERGNPTRLQIQGYLARKKQPPP